VFPNHEKRGFEGRQQRTRSRQASSSFPATLHAKSQRIVFLLQAFQTSNTGYIQPIAQGSGKEIAQRWLVSITTNVHAVQSYDVYQTREVINHKK
jgi:hypothetical protein